MYKKINYIKDNNILIFKPVPSPIDKIQNKYRWQMILKCKVNSKTLDIINYGITDEKISKNVAIYVDINPNNMT